MKTRHFLWSLFPGWRRLALVFAVLIEFGGLRPGQARADGPFTVNSSVDAIDVTPGNGVCEVSTGSGVCTLRAAVMEANFNADADTIILPSGTYTLDRIGLDSTAVLGDLDVLGSLILQGAGQTTTIVDGSLIHDRVFTVGDGNGQFNAVFSGLTIQGGHAGNEGYDQGGGGILLRGANLTVTASTLRNNVSDTIGGAIESVGQFSFARLVLVDTRLLQNRAYTDGGGLYIYGGEAWLTRTLVYGNLTNLAGGGIFVQGKGYLFASRVESNSAAAGGGLDIPAGGNAQLRDSTVRDNFAYNGGGIYNSDELALVNTTLSGNRALQSGGGLYSFTASVAHLYNATVAHNVADYDGDDVGLGGGVARVGGSLIIRNTLIGNNVHNNGIVSPSADDCWGTVTSLGYNLVETTTNCTITSNQSGNITGQDPKLGPLLPHNGAPATHALLPGSPAIDAGNNIIGCREADNVLLVTDQRGLPRHADANQDGSATCDIGAFEVMLQLFLPLLWR
ncbi:MAG: choice-of-anchor Q domain-containing protein [Anaerolineales bacterium]